MSTWSIHLILLIGDLNDLTIYKANIGNAYLEAYTKEKIYLLLERKSPCSEWMVMYSLYLKHYMGYKQVKNDFMKFSNILFALKDLCPAKLILMYG